MFNNFSVKSFAKPTKREITGGGILNIIRLIQILALRNIKPCTSN